MEFKDLKNPVYTGAVSVIISVLLTYGYHLLVHSSTDIEWALVAVAFASFFSGFFAVYDN